LCAGIDEGLMRGRKEVLALALPCHDDREQTRKGVRTAARLAWSRATTGAGAADGAA